MIVWNVDKSTGHSNDGIHLLTLATVYVAYI